MPKITVSLFFAFSLCFLSIGCAPSDGHSSEQSSSTNMPLEPSSPLSPNSNGQQSGIKSSSVSGSISFEHASEKTDIPFEKVFIEQATGSTIRVTVNERRDNVSHVFSAELPNQSGQYDLNDDQYTIILRGSHNGSPFITKLTSGTATVTSGKNIPSSIEFSGQGLLEKSQVALSGTFKTN